MRAGAGRLPASEVPLPVVEPSEGPGNTPGGGRVPRGEERGEPSTSLGVSGRGVVPTTFLSPIRAEVAGMVRRLREQFTIPKLPTPEPLYGSVDRMTCYTWTLPDTWLGFDMVLFMGMDLQYGGKELWQRHLQLEHACEQRNGFGSLEDREKQSAWELAVSNWQLHARKWVELCEEHAGLMNRVLQQLGMQACVQMTTWKFNTTVCIPDEIVRDCLQPEHAQCLISAYQRNVAVATGAPLGVLSQEGTREGVIRGSVEMPVIRSGDRGLGVTRTPLSPTRVRPPPQQGSGGGARVEGLSFIPKEKNVDTIFNMYVVRQQLVLELTEESEGAVLSKWIANLVTAVQSTVTAIKPQILSAMFLMNALYAPAANMSFGSRIHRFYERTMAESTRTAGVADEQQDLAWGWLHGYFIPLLKDNLGSVSQRDLLLLQAPTWGKDPMGRVLNVAEPSDWFRVWLHFYIIAGGAQSGSNFHTFTFQLLDIILRYEPHMKDATEKARTFATRSMVLQRNKHQEPVRMPDGTVLPFHPDKVADELQVQAQMILTAPRHVGSGPTAAPLVGGSSDGQATMVAAPTLGGPGLQQQSVVGGPSVGGGPSAERAPNGLLWRNNPNGVCGKCNKKGHDEQVCFEIFPHFKPIWKKYVDEKRAAARAQYVAQQGRGSGPGGQSGASAGGALPPPPGQSQLRGAIALPTVVTNPYYATMAAQVQGAGGGAGPPGSGGPSGPVVLPVVGRDRVLPLSFNTLPDVPSRAKAVDVAAGAGAKRIIRQAVDSIRQSLLPLVSLAAMQVDAEGSASEDVRAGPLPSGDGMGDKGGSVVVAAVPRLPMVAIAHFRQDTPATGVVLAVGDSRLFVHGVVPDTGCNSSCIGELTCRQMGVPVLGLENLLVNGIGRAVAVGVTPEIAVTLCQGTPYEATRYVRFLVIEGLETVAPCLLSLYVLSHFGVLLDLGKRVMWVPCKDAGAGVPEYAPMPMVWPDAPPPLGEVRSEPSLLEEQQRVPAAAAVASEAVYTVLMMQGGMEPVVRPSSLLTTPSVMEARGGWGGREPRTVEQWLREERGQPGGWLLAVLLEMAAVSTLAEARHQFVGGSRAVGMAWAPFTIGFTARWCRLCSIPPMEEWLEEFVLVRRNVWVWSGGVETLGDLFHTKGTRYARVSQVGFDTYSYQMGWLCTFAQEWLRDPDVLIVPATDLALTRADRVRLVNKLVDPGQADSYLRSFAQGVAYWDVKPVVSGAPVVGATTDAPAVQAVPRPDMSCDSRFCYTQDALPVPAPGGPVQVGWVAECTGRPERAGIVAREGGTGYVPGQTQHEFDMGDDRVPPHLRSGPTPLPRQGVTQQPVDASEQGGVMGGGGRTGHRTQGRGGGGRVVDQRGTRDAPYQGRECQEQWDPKAMQSERRRSSSTTTSSTTIIMPEAGAAGGTQINEGQGQKREAEPRLGGGPGGLKRAAWQSGQDVPGKEGAFNPGGLQDGGVLQVTTVGLGFHDAVRGSREAVEGVRPGERPVVQSQKPVVQGEQYRREAGEGVTGEAVGGAVLGGRPECAVPAGMPGWHEVDLSQTALRQLPALNTGELYQIRRWKWGFRPDRILEEWADENKAPGTPVDVARLRWGLVAGDMPAELQGVDMPGEWAPRTWGCLIRVVVKLAVAASACFDRREGDSTPAWLPMRLVYGQVLNTLQGWHLWPWVRSAPFLESLPAFEEFLHLFTSSIASLAMVFMIQEDGAHTMVQVVTPLSSWLTLPSYSEARKDPRWEDSLSWNVYEALPPRCREHTEKRRAHERRVRAQGTLCRRGEGPPWEGASA